MPQPPLQRREAIAKVQATATTSYSGPLPQPDDLARYDEILPGAANRIVTMAERQMTHRHMMESKVIPHEISLARWGVVSAVAVALGGFALAAYMAYLGESGWGAAVATGDLFGMVSVFVYGTRSRRAEREQKAPPPRR